MIKVLSDMGFLGLYVLRKGMANPALLLVFLGVVAGMAWLCYSRLK